MAQESGQKAVDPRARKSATGFHAGGRQKLKEKTALRTELRRVTSLPGYAYIKGIALTMAGAYMSKLPMTKDDNTSQIGAIMYQGFQMLFEKIENESRHAPKIETDVLVVERDTTEVL